MCAKRSLAQPAGSTVVTTTNSTLKYIAVDGPIGVGKTTLAKMLAETFGGYASIETSGANPFLPEFYRDMRKNAFKTQLYFLLNRYQQQVELKQQDLFKPIVVCDYTFAKDLIFAEINLSEDEMSLYNTIFGLLKERLAKPDMVIYLRADSRVLLQRIKRRGIDYERTIGEKYLDDLTESYNRYFMNYNEAPLLVVDTSNQDYIENREHFETLVREIKSHRGGTVHLIAR